MRTTSGGWGRGSGVTLRVQALAMMLLAGGLLAGVGATMLSIYEQQVTDYGIRGYVEEEILAASEDIGDRLDTQEKLLRQVALSDTARRYLAAPSYRGPVYEGLLRDLRTLVSADRAISLAYLQSAADPYYCCQSDGLPPDKDYTPVGQPWYDLPVARGAFIVTPPYLEDAGESLRHTGRPMISAALPVYDDAGKLSGVAAVDLLLTPSQKLFSPVRLRTRGYAVVAAADGTVLYGPHASPGRVALPRIENVRDYPVAAAVLASREPVLRLKDPETGAWIWAGSGIVRRTGWRIVMVFPEEGLAKDFGAFKKGLLTLGGVGIAVFALLAVLFSSRVSRMERALRGDRDRLREIFDHAPLPAVATDREGRVADANRAFLALTGLDERELRGAALGALVLPDDAAALAELVGRAAEEGSASAELRLIRADGSPAVCDASAARLRCGRPGMLVAARDAAQEKKRAQRMAEIEAELQELNRIMVQREFRVKELRERIRDLERGGGEETGR